MRIILLFVLTIYPILASADGENRINLQGAFQSFILGNAEINISTPFQFAEVFIDGDLIGTTDTSREIIVSMPPDSHNITIRSNIDESEGPNHRDQLVFEKTIVLVRGQVFRLDLSESDFSIEATEEGNAHREAILASRVEDARVTAASELQIEFDILNDTLSQRITDIDDELKANAILALVLSSLNYNPEEDGDWIGTTDEFRECMTLLPPFPMFYRNMLFDYKDALGETLDSVTPRLREIFDSVDEENLGDLVNFTMYVQRNFLERSREFARLKGRDHYLTIQPVGSHPAVTSDFQRLGGNISEHIHGDFGEYWEYGRERNTNYIGLPTTCDQAIDTLKSVAEVLEE